MQQIIDAINEWLRYEKDKTDYPSQSERVKLMYSREDTQNIIENRRTFGKCAAANNGVTTMRNYFLIEWIRVGTDGPAIQEFIDGTSEYGYSGVHFDNAFGKMLRRAHHLYMKEAHTIKLWKINRNGTRTIFSHESE